MCPLEFEKNKFLTPAPAGAAGAGGAEALALQRDAELQGAALRTFLCVAEQCLRANSPGTAPA
jgi:hypothetical protein